MTKSTTYSGKVEPTRRLSGVKGFYQDENWDIEIGPTADQCRVTCNGLPVKNVTEVLVKIVVGTPTEVCIKFLAMDVNFLCPASKPRHLK